MAESVRKRWGCSNDEAVWRRDHSGGDEGVKGEVDKLRVRSCIRSRGKITSNPWLTSPVIMILQFFSFLNVSSVKRVGIKITWWKTFQPIGRLGRKTEKQMRISQPCKIADESQKIMSLVKNLSIQLIGDRGGKPDKGSINDYWKREIWWKIVNEKSLDPGGVLGGKPMPYD